MLSAFIEKSILKHFGKEPTEEQKNLIFNLSRFVNNDTNIDIFVLKGYAGTGKTTVISALVNALNEMEIETILLAPTGRAAKVFTNTSNFQAFTIHKKIYRLKSKNTLVPRFVLNENLHQNAFFIIDEASMISDHTDVNSIFGSGNLMTDLFDFVFSKKNCKILFSGDTAQLPPVGLSVSPALEISTFRKYNKTAEEFELKEVVRQSLDSGILLNATIIRKHLFENKIGKFPKLKINKTNDVKRINGSDLIQNISDSYDKFGIKNTIIITRSNERAIKYNQGIRKSILYREDDFTKNDMIMIVKNNYYWKDEDFNIDFIANGDIAQIMKIKKFENLYDYNFADAELYLPDFDLNIQTKILLDTVTQNSPSLTYDDFKIFYEKISQTYEDIKDKKTRMEKIRNDQHLNALQIKFAYAITCHKAQGGQWDSVFIDQPYANEQMLTLDYFRWLYTAFTRAVDKLFLINFDDSFFD